MGKFKFRWKGLVLLFSALVMMASLVGGCAAGADEEEVKPAAETKPVTNSELAAELEPVKSETPQEALPTQTTTLNSTSAQSDANETSEPPLLGELSRNCQLSESQSDFNNVGLQVGRTALNFTLKDTEGTEYRLSQLLVDKPVVIVFGSFT